MESIYLLVPLVLVFTLVAVVIYIWAVNSGQYDDLDKDAEQLLFDKDDETHK
jgi:cbb3-type cytochrome oxidase maturation protein